jgi:hypothetical protein
LCSPHRRGVALALEPSEPAVHVLDHPQHVGLALFSPRHFVVKTRFN